MDIEVRRLGPGDEEAVHAARGLFAAAPRPEATQRFLAEPANHLLVAYDSDTPVGFVSGVELTHPDKGTEMFLYELGVDELILGRGVGRTLVEALAAAARGAAWAIVARRPCGSTTGRRGATTCGCSIARTTPRRTRHIYTLSDGDALPR